MCMTNLAYYSEVYPVHDDLCEEVMSTIIDVKTKMSVLSKFLSMRLADVHFRRTDNKKRTYRTTPSGDRQRKESPLQIPSCTDRQ